MTKTELFIELASPDREGVSRWVKVTEFVGLYASLQLGNGGSWCRASSSLAKKYNVEFDKSISSVPYALMASELMSRSIRLFVRISRISIRNNDV